MSELVEDYWQRIGVLMPYPANDLEGQARIGAFQQELQQCASRHLVGRGQCQRYSPARRGIGRARPRRAHWRIFIASCSPI
jgi:hypothetical protein